MTVCENGHEQDAATVHFDRDGRPYCYLCKVMPGARARAGQSVRSRRYDALLNRENAARRTKERTR